MIKKDKKIEKEQNDLDDYVDDGLCLFYIKIDQKNKIEELSDEKQNQILMDSVNSLSIEENDNVGKELNKFFNSILPDNKDGEYLKANYAIAKKIKEDSKYSTKEFEAKHKEYMTTIMNSTYKQNLVITRDITEKLTVCLSTIFSKVKKNNKISKYEDLIKLIEDISPKQKEILEKFKSKNNSKINMNMNMNTINQSASFYYGNPEDENTFINYNEMSRQTPLLNMMTDYNKSFSIENPITSRYSFRELKGKYPIPLETLILREKFENIKSLTFILKQNTNYELSLEPKDVIYNVFLFFNLKWLFPNLIEIELDLTNENILKDQNLTSKDKFNKFLEKTKKNSFATSYQNESKKTRVYDIHRKSNFNENTENNNTKSFEDNDFLSSYSIISNNNKDEEVKRQEYLLKKYMSSLEMIIIYWYFMSTLDSIKVCNFTLPINLEKQILMMLKEKKIYLFDFNLLSNIMTDNIIEATLDFNSLDNKLFQQVINLLFKMNKIKKCNLSFFPPEEYFEPQLLLNFLNPDGSKINHYVNEINTNENADVFFLRKLSELFGNNITKFFIFVINNPKLTELSLIFDTPGILNKVDYYEIIIIKLIINMFIYIDKTPASKNSLTSFTVSADNFSLDNKKHIFLNSFFENINIYKKKNINLRKLSLNMKMYQIKNIYKIIPSRINYLSIGSFDIETFECFVEYITSAEFNIHSEIKSLQVTLGNSILFIEDCYELLERLLVECPKTLEEISIFTKICTKYIYLKKLLEKTNYNNIENIFIQLNKNCLKDPYLNKKCTKELKDNNFMDLRFIKRDEIKDRKILDILLYIGNKYNKNFIDYNIFLKIEQFNVKSYKKKNIIEYK